MVRVYGEKDAPGEIFRHELSLPDAVEEVTLGAGRCLDGRLAGKEATHGIRQLGALGTPVVDAIALEQQGCGGGAGIIGADHLDRTAIARTILSMTTTRYCGCLRAPTRARRIISTGNKTSQRELGSAPLRSPGRTQRRGRTSAPNV